MSLLTDLLSGYRTFYRKYFILKRGVYKELVKKGQSPKAVVIACSDSRVDPALITRAAPGDIFVVRNVANIVPCYNSGSTNYSTGAALEFAIKGLAVEHVVVLGHSECAGIQTLMQPKAERSLDIVSDWVDVADKAREVVLAKSGLNQEEQVAECAKQALKISIDNLNTYPFVKEAIDQGKLSLHAWYFDIATGHLLDYDFTKKEFIGLL